MSDPYAAFGKPIDPYAQYGAPVAAPEQPNTLQDVLRSFATGTMRGVTGLADVADMLTGGARARAEFNKANAASGNKFPAVGAPSETLNQKISAPFGGEHIPQTTAGEYARTIGEFAPAAASGPEGLVARTAAVAIPAISSETAGQITKGTPLEPYARFGAGLIGGGLTGLKANPSAVLGEISPETSALYDEATRLGVTVRPGQAAGRPFTKVADSTLERMPGTGYGTAKNPTNAQQAEQFTRAVSKTFGEDAASLSQNVMSGAAKRIGGDFDTVFSRNAIQLDKPLADKLNTIYDTANDNLLNGGQRDQVAALLQKIKDKMAHGIPANTPLLGKGTPYRLTGDQFQAMNAKGGAIDALTNANDSTVAHYAKQIRTALNDAFERQAPAADSALLKKARLQYKNLKTVEPLAAKAPTGVISPALLAARVRASNPAMARFGAGDLGTLGNIGQRFLKEPPNSGTAERSLVLKLMSNPLNATAEMLAYPVTTPTGRLMRSIINSKKVQPTPATAPLLKLNPYPGLIGGSFGLLSASQQP